jgi:DNA-binding winged helix-turn-helix (wHTH) protein
MRRSATLSSVVPATRAMPATGGGALTISRSRLKRRVRLTLVLRLLNEAKGEVVSVDAIRRALYGKSERCASSVKVAVCQLRKLLGAKFEIQSVRNRGYRIVTLT